jgi:predicted aspartyl protease
MFMRKETITAVAAILGCALVSSTQPALAITAIAQPALPKTAQLSTQQSDLRAVMAAIEVGDAPSLLKLYQDSNDPIVHVWSAMALERVHFNLPAATSDATLCEQNLLDSRPRIALLCGQFQAGNLWLEAKGAEAKKLETELIKRFAGQGVEGMLADMRDFQQREAAISAWTVDRPVADTVLPLDQSASVPTLSAQANGHTFPLVLDTGATNLVLDESAARAYGVKLLDEQGHVNGWLSKGVPTRRGLLDELRMGDITFHHVPVVIVPKQIALIGANLIAPLGTLRISKSTLTIYGSQSSTPACDSPMLVATPLWGQSLRIVPQVLINDLPRSVMLDTGSAQYLLGTQAALNDVTVLHRTKNAIRDIGGSHVFANAKSAKVKLTIAGQPIDMYFNVLTDSSNPHPITIGAGALRDMDFLLDFQHQHQCFLLHPDLH